MHPWLVRWWFSPDLDLLLEQDAAEEGHLEYLDYLEEAKEFWDKAREFGQDKQEKD